MHQNFKNKSIKIYFFSKQYMLKKNIRKFDLELVKEFSHKNFLTPNQTHSTNIIFSNTPGNFDNCDGVFTSNPKIICSIKVADCMPIFFAHQDVSFYGVVHAGWKGLVDGILLQVSTLLKKKKYKLNKFDILIGPSIQNCCFEVSSDIVNRFPLKFVKPKKTGKYMVDLQKIAFDELSNIGFAKNQIKISNDCSFCESDIYFSYRRDGDGTGRMIGLIGFEA